MPKAERKGFIMYNTYLKQVNILSDKDAGILFKALLNYSQNGTEPDFDGILEIAFSFMQDQIMRDSEKYTEVCKKRSEAGKKGGRPRKNPEEKTNCISSKAKKANIKENEKENEKVKENVIVSGKVKENAPAVNTPPEALPETTTDNNNTSNKYFGKRVVLTQEQYDSLVDTYGQKTIDIYIAKVDEYLENHPVTPYRNHHLTLTKWLTEDNCPTINKNIGAIYNNCPDTIDLANLILQRAMTC